MTALYNRNMTPMAPIRVALDTNVVLDAWWFEDARALTLRRAIEAGELQWVASAAMRAELQDVLTRQPFVERPAQCERTLTAFDRWSLILDQPPTRSALICTDPDDQCFLDLALACHAGWLFTRDRALLDLARRAAGHGCCIVSPSAWASGAPAATSAADPGP